MVDFNKLNAIGEIEKFMPCKVWCVIGHHESSVSSWVEAVCFYQDDAKKILGWLNLNKPLNVNEGFYEIIESKLTKWRDL